MNGQTHWLFETPSSSKVANNNYPYTSFEFEDEEDQWEDEVFRPRKPGENNNLSDSEARQEIQLAILNGIRDVKLLTDIIFYCRFEVKTINQDDPNRDLLTEGWRKIRDGLVRPTLRLYPLQETKNSIKELNDSYSRSVQAAIKADERDENKLTDDVYTDYGWRPIQSVPKESHLWNCQGFSRKEWLRIRDVFVRPALKRVSSAKEKAKSLESDRYTNPYFNAVLEYEWESPPNQQKRAVSIQDEIAWERANPKGRIEQNSDGCLILSNFAVGSAALKSNHRQRLLETVRRQIDRMRFDLTAFISIEGHTSPTGLAARNQQISVQRARAVKAFLVAGGLSGSQIHVMGVGASSPLVPNTTAENMARNRRVVICIAQLT
jgi:outer membrane protein OmpA-like peptidoglycan-associated protein